MPARTGSISGSTIRHHLVSLVVDPKNPDIVLAAALGHTYARNEERGVFRSTDGGRTWTKVLYKGDNIGAVNMVADPDNPQTLFAALEVYLTIPDAGRGGRWRRRFWWPRSAAEPAQPGAGIYKSTDQGRTWTYLTGHGLPEGNMGRIGLAVAGGTHGQRVYAVMTGGMYRSDDGGANWYRSTTDPRPTGSAYFSMVYVAPDNPDMVYVVQTVALSLGGRRPDVYGFQRRARRRRLPRAVDRPDQQQAHPRGRQPGPHHQRRWRLYLGHELV